MRRLALSLVVALVALGCTERNPDYCPDAGTTYKKSCSRYNAALDARHESQDAVEAAEAGDAVEAGDAIEVGDATDAPAEKPPVCTVDDDCAADGGTNLACDKSGPAPRCVECVESKHCKDTTKPACDTKAHRCVECVGMGTECTGFTGRPVCDVPAQKCVECIDDTQCTGRTPVCDTTKQQCRACAADAECKAAPGVCVDWDGHCAQATEVVTLGGAGCVQAAPSYCKASDAAAALSPGRPVLVVKGPDPVGEIDPPAGAATQILIVGRSGASVGAGSGDSAGIHLAGGTKYWVRDLTVSGGTVGIFAEGATEVHINRCTVTANGKGGIKTVSSGFDITNTIIAGNMPGSDIGGVGFGGVRLGDVPAGAPSRFANNTVVDNKQVGVSCKVSTYDTSTSILHNNVGGDAINCAGTLCCAGGDPDPMLDASYHLKAGSPCVDQITATMSTVTTDIDGQPRPTPPAGKLDCGADERM